MSVHRAGLAGPPEPREFVPRNRGACRAGLERVVERPLPPDTVRGTAWSNHLPDALIPRKSAPALVLVARPGHPSACYCAPSFMPGLLGRVDILGHSLPAAHNARGPRQRTSPGPRAVSQPVWKQRLGHLVAVRPIVVILGQRREIFMSASRREKGVVSQARCGIARDHAR